MWIARRQQPVAKINFLPLNPLYCPGRSRWAAPRWFVRVIWQSTELSKLALLIPSSRQLDWLVLYKLAPGNLNQSQKAMRVKSATHPQTLYVVTNDGQKESSQDKARRWSREPKMEPHCWTWWNFVVIVTRPFSSFRGQFRGQKLWAFLSGQLWFELRRRWLCCLNGLGT